MRRSRRSGRRRIGRWRRTSEWGGRRNHPAAL